MAVSQLTKTCKQCKVEKPLGEFKPQKRGKYGVESLCVPCLREYKAAHQRKRRKNPDLKERERLLRNANRKTPHAIAYQRSYQSTPKYKEYRRRKKATPEYRQKASEYATSDQGKRIVKAWMSTPGGKESCREARMRYRRKPSVQERMRTRSKETYRRLIAGTSNHATLLHPQISTDLIIELYAQGLTTIEIGCKVGLSMNGVNWRLKRAGIPLRKNAYNSRKHVCNDGHVVRSALERVVDDWLHSHNIPHEVEPKCPWPPRTTKANCADFKVGDYFIELWGMPTKAFYRRKMEYKLEQYKKFNVKLIEIFPINVFTLNFECLAPLLRYANQLTAAVNENPAIVAVSSVPKS